MGRSGADKTMVGNDETLDITHIGDVNLRVGTKELKLKDVVIS
jgi:hypothetical protein